MICILAAEVVKSIRGVSVNGKQRFNCNPIVFRYAQGNCSGMQIYPAQFCIVSRNSCASFWGYSGFFPGVHIKKADVVGCAGGLGVFVMLSGKPAKVFAQGISGRMLAGKIRNRAVETAAEGGK